MKDEDLFEFERKDKDKKVEKVVPPSDKCLQYY